MTDGNSFKFLGRKGGGAGLSRRHLLVSGGVASAGLVAAGMTPHARAVAAEPMIDTSFKDFTLPKFSCDDSLVKVQQRGELIIGTSDDWPYSYLAPNTNEFSGIDSNPRCCPLLPIQRPPRVLLDGSSLPRSCASPGHRRRARGWGLCGQAQPSRPLATLPTRT